jgi:hypothetical protein
MIEVVMMERMGYGIVYWNWCLVAGKGSARACSQGGEAVIGDG